MEQTYVLAMDTDQNLAHACATGSDVTACQLPTAGFEIGHTDAFSRQTFAMCGDCRAAYGR